MAGERKKLIILFVCLTQRCPGLRMAGVLNLAFQQFPRRKRQFCVCQPNTQPSNPNSILLFACSCNYFVICSCLWKLVGTRGSTLPALIFPSFYCNDDRWLFSSMCNYFSVVLISFCVLTQRCPGLRRQECWISHSNSSPEAGDSSVSVNQTHNHLTLTVYLFECSCNYFVICSCFWKLAGTRGPTLPALIFPRF